MATKKFAGPSPYTMTFSYPEADYLHTEYVNNVTTTQKYEPKQPLVAALFGLGRAGTFHLNNMVREPRIILKYIVDDQVHRFKDMRRYWSLGDKVKFLTSTESDQVYKDKEVKVVFITSPTFTHRDIVINSIANDKDVFCEKPIAESIEDARKCYQAAKDKGRILFTAFNRRFDPAHRALHENVRKGVVGHIQILKITARDPPIPSIEYLKQSGGIFHDCLVHDFDMCCWVLGELPVRVQATASALIPEIKAINDFDTVAYVLTFPSGAVALGDNSRYSSYGYDQRLEVFGNKGMIKIDNERPCHSTEVLVGHEGIKLNPIFYSCSSRHKTAYQRELVHFLDVVQHGVPMDVNSWQILAVSKIATAVEKSVRTGQTVFLDWSSDDIPEVYS